MEKVIECRNLTHYYGEKLVYENLNFSVEKGRIFGLLGKNGTGKTTTINILNGYLEPTAGECLIFGENSQHLSPQTKARIGFLMEGHIQHTYMNIYQIEKFYSAFYPNWKKEPYFELMSKLEITPDQKISTMSCGQRSQVALGLILAQDPDLMILDDYSMGLDPGYRRLFIDYLTEYAKSANKTIFVTSHIIQDMEQLIDDVMIMDYRSILVSMPMNEFLKSFKKFRIMAEKPLPAPARDGVIKNYEQLKNKLFVYSFEEANRVREHLHELGYPVENFEQIPMTLEDAFIGLTGKY
ncbi:MAG: ABC transporter ATP-binding protein [Calditrichia bacterium]